MRINEFGNYQGQGQGQSTIEDELKDHPEIYEFMQNTVGNRTLEQQTRVEMFDMSSAHHVILSIRPALGIDSTEIMLQRQKVQYELIQMASGDMIVGKLSFANFRVTHESTYGDPTEKWDFEIPNKR